MKPNHYAVVVGIDQYPAMPPLRYARNDAIAFYEWLTSPDEGGVPKSNTKLIMATDSQQTRRAKRPLRGHVIDTLTDFHTSVGGLDESEWSESRLYIYLAGHGVVPREAGGALLFADANAGSWGDMLDLDICERFYRKCRFFKEIVLLGDFCRDTPDEPIPALGELTFRGCPGIKSRKTRRVTGYATSMSLQALEPDDTLEELPAIITVPPTSPSNRKPRGFFTAAVLEGLRGGADPDPISGVIDIDRLDTFVKKQMRKLSGSSYQEPEIAYPNAKDLVLVRYQVPKYPVDLLVPEGFAEPIDVVLHGKDDLVMGSWTPGDPLRWSVRLPKANYEAVARSQEYIFKGTSMFKVTDSPRKHGYEVQGGVQVVPL